MLLIYQLFCDITKERVFLSVSGVNFIQHRSYGYRLKSAIFSEEMTSWYATTNFLSAKYPTARIEKLYHCQSWTAIRARLSILCSRKMNSLSVCSFVNLTANSEEPVFCLIRCCQDMAWKALTRWHLKCSARQSTAWKEQKLNRHNFKTVSDSRHCRSIFIYKSGGEMSRGK